MKKKFKFNLNRSKKPLQLVYVDLVGPTSKPLLSSIKYFTMFIKDYSQRNWIYFFKIKREVFFKFCIFKIQVKNETYEKLLILKI